MDESLSLLVHVLKQPGLFNSTTTPIPRITRILVFEKTELRKNHISGTVLMIQLMQNSPTCAYIGQNLSK